MHRTQLLDCCAGKSACGTKLRRAARLRRSANRGIADYAVGDPHVLTGDVGRARSSHHSRRPRKRSCDSMTDSSSCARSSPARPRLGLFVRSLSIRRSAAATRSRARSKSAMVYCRGFGRVRFLRGPFAALLARMAALSCFPVAIGPLRFSRRIPPIKHIRRVVASRVALTWGVHGTEPTTSPSSTLPGTGQENPAEAGPSSGEKCRTYSPGENRTGGVGNIGGGVL